MTRFVPLAAACFLGWLAVPTASAQNPQPNRPGPAAKSAVVTRVAGTITLDGVLDEPIWRTAPLLGGLTQRTPNQGVPPTERTVTLLYDRDHLYVGVVAHISVCTLDLSEVGAVSRVGRLSPRVGRRSKVATGS